ncbi:dihydroxyacetone kinase subunit DhaL [Brachyspira pilosicoli]|uniref:dihydroxyacetone kinase subunit DhaL n=1 Tax=Brachyspira pilosicoli TaxID=52584 RepID=UPI0030063233
MNIDKIKLWINNLADVYEENKDYLSKLDADIGDADHGINISRGFKFVKEAIANTNDIASLFKTTATALIKNVGGASGPLYGTFFLNAGISANKKDDLSLNDIAEIFDKGTNAIAALGKSKAGEKTMLDTLYPALNAMKENANDIEKFRENVLLAAENGMKSTIDMLATKGRASYLGDRSIGHQDPGATSMFMLIKSLIAHL